MLSHACWRAATSDAAVEEAVSEAHGAGTDLTPTSSASHFSLAQLLQQLELLVPHSVIVSVATIVRHMMPIAALSSVLTPNGEGWQPWQVRER